MKRSERRRTRPVADAATDAAGATVRAAWIRGSHSLLLGSVVALIVATPLIPGLAAIPFGSHVILTMAWLVLTAAWLMRCLLDEKPVWHVGPTGAALGVFLAVHSLSAVVMMHHGHGRPTLNALWLWVSFGLTFLAVRQLARSSVEQRALVSVLIALAVGFSGFGIYQTVYAYPRQRAEYETNPDRALNDAGVCAPAGSPQRRHFEDRLASSEPTGPFALTNSLAGFLAPCLVLLAGLAVGLWRSLGTRRPAVSAWTLSGTLVAASVVLTCLILTKSRSGYLAALAGLGLLALSNTVPRVWLRWRWLAAGAAGLVVIGAGITLFGGLDRQVLTEAPKSLLYRFQYWQASAAMIADHTWLGCGPGNFQDYYTRYKLPEASETIADPHNFLVQVAATAGMPAMGLFVLVGGVFLCRVWRRRVSRTEVAGNTVADPAASVPVYLGAGAGFLLAYPVGWIGGHSPMLDMLWVTLPAALLTIWLLQPWVTRGSLPAGPLLVAAGTLLVNLLAAGGIGYPGVAVLLWVLVALTLNVVENDEQVDPAPRPRLPCGPVVSRVAIFLAAAAAMLFVLLGYVTMYRPVLAGYEFTAFLGEAVVRDYSAEEVVQQSRKAAQADRWWGEPCAMRAEMLHQQWIDSPSTARLGEFNAAAMSAQQRNRQSPGLASRQGDWLIAMYAASGRVDLLERAVEAYARAVSLYPNSSLGHAQLASACSLAGDAERARREADHALRLDRRMPHDELKLKYRVLSGAVAVRGGAAPSVRGEDPEQLMRDIRKSRSP